MKKAVISTGGRQYLVTEGEQLSVNFLKSESAKKVINFETLLVLDDKKTSVGSPVVKGSTVSAEVINPSQKAEKVTAIRYKAKKRVHKVRGHRQTETVIKITKII